MKPHHRIHTFQQRGPVEIPGLSRDKPPYHNINKSSRLVQTWYRVIYSLTTAAHLTQPSPLRTGTGPPLIVLPPKLKAPSYIHATKCWSASPSPLTVDLLIIIAMCYSSNRLWAKTSATILGSLCLQLPLYSSSSTPLFILHLVHTSHFRHISSTFTLILWTSLILQVSAQYNTSCTLSWHTDLSTITHHNFQSTPIFISLTRYLYHILRNSFLHLLFYRCSLFSFFQKLIYKQNQKCVKYLSARFISLITILSWPKC